MPVQLSRSLLLVVLIPAMLCGAGPPVSSSSPPPDDLRIMLRQQAIEKLIEAALPYRFEVDLGLFKQVIALSEPRNLHLFHGGLRFSMTAAGSPLPLDGEIAPELRLVENAETGEMEIRIQALPVTMGLLGKYDLATLVEPISIEKASRYLLAGSGGQIELHLLLLGIEVGPGGIEIRFRTDFKPVRPGAEPSAGGHGAP